MSSLLLSLINILIFLNVAYSFNKNKDSVVLRVWNGSVAGENQFPYVGYLSSIDQVGSEFRNVVCGGSIIHKNWVLTAGHCCEKIELEPMFTAGTPDIGGKLGQDRSVEKFITHESIYKDEIVLPDGKRVYVNFFDVGLLKLKEPFEFNVDVQPIKLDWGYGINYVDKTATYMGWGADPANKNYELSYNLMYGEGRIDDIDDCDLKLVAHMAVVTGHHICTIDDYAKKGTCDGDSGGPLVVGNLQIGITSDVFCPLPGKDEKHLPSVFINITTIFPWIKEKLGECGDDIFEMYGDETPIPKPAKPRPNAAKCNVETDCSKALAHRKK